MILTKSVIKREEMWVGGFT